MPWYALHVHVVGIHEYRIAIVWIAHGPSYLQIARLVALREMLPILDLVSHNIQDTPGLHLCRHQIPIYLATPDHPDHPG